MSTLLSTDREHNQAVSGDASNEHRLLVERIARSGAFSKSSRLTALLRYLAECTLRGDRAGLTEQAIGRSVFEKPTDFNPTEDSSVRVHVRQLRLRLYEYFQSVGRDERIVVEVPKGGYGLSFQLRHSANASPETEQIASESKDTVPEAALKLYEKVHSPVRWLPWALCAFMFLAAFTGWVCWYRVSSALLPPWPLNQVIEPEHSTTMVLADASYVLRMLSDRAVTLDEYADRSYFKDLIPPTAATGELSVFHYLQVAQITSMADARAVQAVTSLAGNLRDRLVIRSAKEMTGSGMVGGNLIIVGAATSNPWEEQYASRTNFSLAEGYIENRAPRLGEQPRYEIHETTGFSGEDFATISLLPGAGDQGKTLLIQGLRREGTDAAVAFLTASGYRSALESKLRSANGGDLPKYFEVLLRSHAVAGSATSVDCIAVRVGLYH